MAKEPDTAECAATMSVGAVAESAIQATPMLSVTATDMFELEQQRLAETWMQDWRTLIAYNHGHGLR